MAATMPTTAAPPASGGDEALYIDTQHEDLVHDVQMDFYGAKVATCSSGKCVFLRSKMHGDIMA